MRWRDGLTCPACGHRGFCRLETRQPFQCNRCKWQDPFPIVLAQPGRAHLLAIRLARPALGRSRAKEEAMTRTLLKSACAGLALLAAACVGGSCGTGMATASAASTSPP